jgi:hypothetical protein
MKLYRVHCEIEYEVLCLAESAKDARRAVEDDYAEQELDVRSFSNMLVAYQAEEVTSIDKIDKDWRGGLVYHPGEEDITVEQAFEMVSPAPTPRETE